MWPSYLYNVNPNTWRDGLIPKWDPAGIVMMMACLALPRTDTLKTILPIEFSFVVNVFGFVPILTTLKAFNLRHHYDSIVTAFAGVPGHLLSHLNLEKNKMFRKWQNPRLADISEMHKFSKFHGMHKNEPSMVILNRYLLHVLCIILPNFRLIPEILRVVTSLRHGQSPS